MNIQDAQHGKTDFHDRIALVTGAAQGIGKAVVARLINLGALVVALDKSAENLALLQYEIASASRLKTHCVDITRTEQIEQALARIVQQHGHLDYLIHVAGILQTGHLINVTDEEWEQVFAVNTTGAFKIARSVGRIMIHQQQGSIVMVSSNASSTPRINMGAYAASKAATTQMARCLGLELAKHGIRVNVVSPGSTNTPMQDAFCQSVQGTDTIIRGDNTTFRTGIPLGRVAQPENIAEAILFLLSRQAQHITLHDLRVDGGATLDMR